MSNKVIPLGGPGVTPRGRLMFAIDVAASRAPTWNTVCELQAKIFGAAAPIGQLEVQLVCYHGRDGCQASKWMSSAEQLAYPTNPVECECQNMCTEVGRVLEHALRENDKTAIQALVLIGGHVDEPMNILRPMAENLGKQGVPIFIFHEDYSRDIPARHIFRQLALKSGGTYFESDPEKLSEQLGTVARVAVGDVGAIERLTGSSALTDQCNSRDDE
jgi:hypothetical protein